MVYRSLVKLPLFFGLWFGLWIVSLPTLCATPEQMQDDWTQWVKDRHDNIACPWAMSNDKQRVCEWPGRLVMTLSAKGLDFSFDINVYRHQAHVQLPGSKKHWPTQVTISGKPAPVIEDKQAPFVVLSRGRHVIKGRFLWSTTPHSLKVPSAIAFIELYENGRRLAVNRRNNTIIFSQQQVSSKPHKRDSLSVEVYRLLSDGVPLRLETQLKLSVSGKPREIKIGKVLLENTVLTDLNSALPARVESDGDIRVQVVAGEHRVRLVSRYQGSPSTIVIAPSSSDWPNYEYISFAADTHLRQVKLSGAVSIDTTQVSIPAQWQHFPTYRMDKNTRLNLVTEFRGDHAPVANQLHINRDLWLDFDGRAITTLDKINGKMYQDWRLNTLADTHIGRAKVADQPVLITKDNNQQGIEIRSPDIKLQAVTRVSSPKQFSASGWDASADSYRATLHLPPGWRVLHASGVDTIYGTWVSQWDLWDIFLLLIIVAATRKLLGLKAAALSVLTLMVIYHEQGALILYFPVLLLVLALLPILNGRIKNVVTSSALMVSVLLLISVLAFAVSSFRLAIYPTLEKSQLGQYQKERSRAPVAARSVAVAKQGVARIKENYDLEEAEVYSEDDIDVNWYEVDENDRVQTGPGLPTWTWNAIHLQSSSPVSSDQLLSFVYCSPLITGIWRVLSVFLLMAYTGILLLSLAKRIKQTPTDKNAEQKNTDKPNTDVATASSVVLLCLAIGSGLILPANHAEAAEYPPKFLLQELEDKLLKAPKCLPHCVSLNNVKLLAGKSDIRLSLNVYADADIAMPIPSGRGSWLPEKVLVDGKQAVPAREHNNQIEVFLSKGHHAVSLTGRVLDDQVSIVFPLPIHNVTAHSEHWIIEGVVNGQLLNNTLSLRSRAKNQADKTDSLIPDPIAPMVIVEREFILGKQWKLKTRALRFAPAVGAITVNIPLLEYEKVLSDTINTEQGIAQLQFGHNQREITWLSSLEPMDKLTLIAKDNPHYLENWRFEPSSLWRIRYDGLPAIKEANDVSSLQPFWKPWPNEQLTVAINRPVGVQGPTHTVESAKLVYKAGKRLQKSVLTLDIHSSMGEDYRFTLPEAAEVLALSINGRQLNLPAANRITVPLQPGQQTLRVEFQQQQQLGWVTSSPDIRLPGGATNITLSYSLPRDRWPLYITGPAIGPAMLYWGVLCVIVLGAVALSILARKLALPVPVTLLGWLLLGVGLSTVNSYGVLLVAAFFFLLAARKQHIQPDTMDSMRFNALQCVIVGWTIITAVAVISAIPMGLLSNPDMKVVGNNSHSHQYYFYQDRVGESFPSARVVSVSLFSYRVVMMLWSLWLASRIIHWAVWWWQAYSEKGIWRSRKTNVPEQIEKQ